MPRNGQDLHPTFGGLIDLLRVDTQVNESYDGDTMG